MNDYAYSALYKNEPVVLLAFYFEGAEMALNRRLAAFGARVAECLDVDWHTFAAAFAREDLPIQSFREYKRTARRWAQLLALMETELLANLGLNSYHLGETEGECVAALNIDVRIPLDKPNVCYLRLSPRILGPNRIEQVEEWLLSIVASAIANLEPLYGLVHVGDKGLDWYLYLCGIEDASFPVEYAEDLDVFGSSDVLRTEVPRVYWGNLLNRQHLRKLASVDDLRAWELGSREWQQYHNAVPSEEFRRRKGIPDAAPGRRVDWPVRVYELESEYALLCLSSNPLDWSPNVGIDGLIKPEFKRLTRLFRSTGLMT